MPRYFKVVDTTTGKEVWYEEKGTDPNGNIILTPIQDSELVQSLDKGRQK